VEQGRVQYYPAGLADEQVLEIARTEQRILIANDKDFGELAFRRSTRRCRPKIDSAGPIALMKKSAPRMPFAQK
jgi:hypothetical protein